MFRDAPHLAVVYERVALLVLLVLCTRKRFSSFQLSGLSYNIYKQGCASNSAGIYVAQQLQGGWPWQQSGDAAEAAECAHLSLGGEVAPA